MWNEYTSLSDMQTDIRKIFESSMHLQIKICDIINIQPNDYFKLVSKLRLIKNPDEMEAYGLAFLVAWVTAFKLKREDEFYKMVRQIFQTIPQHHTKFIIEAINTLCYDFQIDLYGTILNNFSDVRKVVKIHAGF